MREREIRRALNRSLKKSAKQMPLATIENAYDIPVIRAAIELDRNNPAKAVEILQPATPYDLAGMRGMLSAYERGRAYLAVIAGAKQPRSFRKLSIIRE